MLNEICLVKNLYIKNDFLQKIDVDFEYYDYLLCSRYEMSKARLSEIDTMQNNCLEKLVHIHCHYSDIISTFQEIIKITHYALRRNQLLSHMIKFDFDQNKSIYYLLNETVDLIVDIKNAVPIPKYAYKDIEKVYAAVDKFTTHGHYLLNLSRKKNEYCTEDALLYLKHVYKTLSLVYEYGVLEMIRKYPRNKIEN